MKRAFRFSLYPLAFLLSIVLGCLSFNYFIGKPQIGIINISGIIWQPRTTENILQMLQYASESRAIKAVVLVIDSPGGLAEPTEEIYLDTIRLKAKKPVIASVNQVAASGGYYIAAAANYIYAKPTSYVGSIGALTSLPTPEDIDESTISTGPFKLTGSGTRKAMFELEMLKEGFLQAVISQRGERLKLSKEELSRAEIYNGIEGTKYGLIDKIGTTVEAVNKAAEYAGIRRYDVVDVNKALGIVPLPTYFFQKPSPLPSGLTPVNYYLYLETE